MYKKFKDYYLIISDEVDYVKNTTIFNELIKNKQNMGFSFLLITEKIDKNEFYQEQDTDYKNGDIVMHTIYGKGVVIEVNDKILTIAFAKNFGIKKLMKNHKSLKKLN